MDKLDELLHRLERIEEGVRLLTQLKVVQEFYSTGDVAQIMGKAEFTVREWCRLGRIKAAKRTCGRGNSKEWLISHEELQRVQSLGLLPPEHGVHRSALRTR